MRNKFNAYKIVYKGIVYHSKKEGEYAMILDDKIVNQEIKRWRRQIKFPLEVNGKLVSYYIVDFEVENNDGKKELIEVKGMKTAYFKLKFKLFKALYPGIKITII